MLPTISRFFSLWLSNARNWIRFIASACQLALYSLLLLPGHLYMLYFYVTTPTRHTFYYCRHDDDSDDSNKKKNIVSSRHQVDLYYVPKKKSNKNNEEIKTDERRVDETHRMDPAAKDNGCDRRPILLIFPGGAWMIGYKLWGALLAQALSCSGHFVVAVADYRNYPWWGRVPDMVEDVQHVWNWLHHHLGDDDDVGADTSRIIVIGQSAGGHIAANLWLDAILLDKGHVKSGPSNEKEKEAGNKTTTGTKNIDQKTMEQTNGSPKNADTTTSTNPTDDNKNEKKNNEIVSTKRDDANSMSTPTTISKNHCRPQHIPFRPQGLILLSCPYDLTQIRSGLTRFGINDNTFFDMFSDDQNNQQVDRYDLIKRVSGMDLRRHIYSSHAAAPILILHGKRDATIPYEVAQEFGNVLQKRGFAATVDIRQDWCHTDPVVELIHEGRQGDLCRTIVHQLREWKLLRRRDNKQRPSGTNALGENNIDPKEFDLIHGRLCYLVNAARAVSPF